MGTCEYDNIRLVVNADATIDVFEENDRNQHRIGQIPFQDRDIDKFNEKLADLIIEASITAQQAGSKQEMLDKISAMKIYWVLGFER